MAKSDSYDLPLLRDAASPRWREILVHEGGIDDSLLDGRHHPCPKCGGSDRFRLLDQEKGALLCNQCFNSKNGDGIAAIQWLTGDDFQAAIARIAGYLGVKPTANGKQKKKADPAEHLVFREWSDMSAAFWMKEKPGVTAEGIKRAGGQLATYRKKYAVFAFPIFQQDVEKPVGWVIYDVHGGDLPQYGNKDQDTTWIKLKVTAGSQRGLMGKAAVEAMAEKPVTVWKVEGVTDMVALYSADPNVLVVSNAFGAGEEPGPSALWLRNHKVRILHDADKPGDVGAVKWAAEVAKHTIDCRRVHLPYEIVEDHGKDLRSWLVEGGTFEELTKMALAVEPFDLEVDTPTTVDGEDPDYASAKRVCATAGLDVLGRTEDGHVKVFSMQHRAIDTIRDVDRLGYARVLMIGGSQAKKTVAGPKSVAQGRILLTDLKDEIATVAGFHRLKDARERGMGVWMVEDSNAEEPDRVVLVGKGESLLWDGENYTRHIEPRLGDMLIDMGAGEAWFDQEKLEGYMTECKADPEWSRNVLDETVAILARWLWKHQEIQPTVAAGLILASWIQSLWSWRPAISLSGASNSGKTYLFKYILAPLFGPLAQSSSESTEAGIRQAVRDTSQVILLDEFEHSASRAKVLELFRTSSRGDKILRGTAGQKGVAFGLQHIPWVAAIEVGLKRAPDRNRFIMLDLVKPREEDMGNLDIPPATHVADLGQKILTVAVRHALPARALAHDLRSISCPGIDTRIVESFAVPASILGLAWGFPREKTEVLLRSMLEMVDQPEQGLTDSSTLIDSILAAFVDCGRGVKYTVGQMLESPGTMLTEAGPFEAFGLKVVNRRSEPSACLFVDHRLVASRLLKGTMWEQQSIDQLLLRIRGTGRCQQDCHGGRPWGIYIPMVVMQGGEYEGPIQETRKDKGSNKNAK